MKFAFGVHQGKDIQEIPRDYLEWLLKFNTDINSHVKTELDRRDALESSQMSMMEQVFRAGYKSLAARLHPDNLDTGNAEEFLKLRGANEQFKVIMEEVKKAEEDAVK